MEEEYAHKNRLQEYTQRAGVSLPDYQTRNEGSQHDPKFRSSVTVDGAKFVSPRVFRRLKEAEQYVAKVAFEEICSMIKLKGIPLLYKDKTFSKSILHEYAARMRLDLPEYTTSTSTGPFQTFITSVLFDGKTFAGGPGRNVKDAEQIGARTLIEYILGQSETRVVMAEIIKSKSKLFNALHCGRQPAPTTHAIATDMTMTPIKNHSAEVVLKEIEATLPNNILLEHSIHPRMGNPGGQICARCSGNIFWSRTVSTPMATVNNPPEVSENNPPKAPTSHPVYNVSNAQAVQVRTELPLKLHITNPGVGGKRSRKNKTRKKSKGARCSGNICRTPMATVNNPPEVSENNPPKASTSQAVHNVCNAQAVQVKTELPLKLHITNPGVGGKRSRKNKSRKKSKKKRVDESSRAAA